MKSIKIYLIVVSVLLLLALIAGIYVWYIYQTVQSPIIENAFPTEVVVTFEYLVSDTGAAPEQISDRREVEVLS